MQKLYNFSIDSDSSAHSLSLNGKEIATFDTLEGAEEMANLVAGFLVPGTKLSFGLDFKWTLSDLEIRAARLEWESPAEDRQGDSLCG
jgi:hypothetical protein